MLNSLVRLTAKATRLEYRRLGRCTVHHPLTRDVQLLAKWSTGTDGLTTYDLCILDTQQRVLVSMEKLTLKLSEVYTPQTVNSGMHAPV